MVVILSAGLFITPLEEVEVDGVDSSGSAVSWLGRLGRGGSDAESEAGDQAACYLRDEAFLAALRTADLQLYTFGAPRVGNRAFSQVRADSPCLSAVGR